MTPLSSKALACCLMLPILMALHSSRFAEAKKATPECLPAGISPSGEICADGMAFNKAKQLCCKSRRVRAAACFPAITSPQGRVLCPDWMAIDQEKQLCCKKNAGSTGLKKGKNGH